MEVGSDVVVVKEDVFLLLRVSFEVGGLLVEDFSCLLGAGLDILGVEVNGAGLIFVEELVPGDGREDRDSDSSLFVGLDVHVRLLEEVGGDSVLLPDIEVVILEEVVPLNFRDISEDSLGVGLPLFVDGEHRFDLNCQILS